MRQLEDALHVLSSQGIQIVSWKAINRGNNSRIYRLTSNQNLLYELEFYKPSTSSDVRNWLQAKRNLLSYLQTTEASKQNPTLIYSYPEQNWSLFSWLKGQLLEVPDREQLKQITALIVKANPKSSKPEGWLKPASEVCLNHKSIGANLKNAYIFWH